MESISFYVSITTGVLLTISETLPFIKKVKSNGIVQSIIEALTKKNVGSSEESSQLLTSQNGMLRCDEQRFENLQKQISILRQSSIESSSSLTFDKDSKITILIEPN